MAGETKIKSIDFKSFMCFEDFVIDCTKGENSVAQWTVLLGNNNTGKTSLLKAIAGLRPTRLLFGSRPNLKMRALPAAITDSKFFRNIPENHSRILSTLLHYGKDFAWQYSGDFEEVSIVSPETFNDSFHIYAYGVSRYPASSSLSDYRSNECATLYSTEDKLINIEEWLMQLDYSAKNEKNLAANRLYRIQEIICSSLFPEITDFRFESSDELHNYMEFRTKDGWVRYTQLGFGYQSMLSWVIDFCKRMFERYPDSENPLHESAVVLIDEIDLHLHPEWQRNIISFLSNAFPNTQFIVTTHSPLVIQSMDEVNLYILHRDGDKVRINRSLNSNFIGWTVEEILRDTMMMDDDIRTTQYQIHRNVFNDGLNQEDYSKAKEAYDVLMKILHPNNPTRQLMELQLSYLKHD